MAGSTFIQKIKLLFTGAKGATKDAKKFESSLKKIQKTAITLGASFFAAQGIIQGFKKMAELATQHGKVQSGFMSLGKEIGITTLSLNKFREAVNGTMSDTELMTLANQSMMLGVASSEQEMAKLFDTAQRLGRVMGLETKDSIESLVTGIGRQCLTGDSIVLLENGTKTIKEIKKGDIVVAYHKDKGFIKTEVSHLLDNGIQPVFELICEDNNKIKSTDNHRYLTDKGWKELKDINIGDLILNADGNYSTVKSINFLNKERVYDLTVPETENFFANGLCVHNSIQMLDNLGIIVKSETAYQLYAESIGKTSNQLTEQEKKLAFNAEAMRQATNAVALLGEENLNASDRLDALTVSAENFWQMTGTEWRQNLERFLGLFGEQAGSSITYWQTYKAAQQAAFDADYDGARDQILGIVSALEETNPIITAQGESIDTWTENFSGNITHQKAMIEGYMEAQAKRGNVDKEVMLAMMVWQGRLEELQADELARMNSPEYLAEVERQKEENEAIAKRVELAKEAELVKEKEFEMLAQSSAAWEDAALATKNLDMARNEFFENSEGISSVANLFTAHMKNMTASSDGLTKSQINSAMAVGAANKSAAKAAGQAASMYIMAKAQEAVASFLADAFAKGGIFGGILGAGAAGAVGSLFSGAVKQISETAFAAEGMNEVVTEPTLILAGEAGPEYVDIEPTTNEGAGRGGGVNISFTGNVLSSDFIENEAVPLLKEALRKGGDIGIS